MYHYAANNPVKYTDPDGKEARMVFVVDYYKKTEYGTTAYGKLTVTDLYTNESITVNAYSGGIKRDSDGISLPIPLGKYEILSETDIGYRLEPLDSNFGNDIIDGPDKRQETLRLHGPGATYGCVAINTKEEKAKVDALLQKTIKSTSEVNSKSRNPFIKTESLIKYGTLEVRQSLNAKYSQKYVYEGDKKKYEHQQMDRKEPH